MASLQELVAYANELLNIDAFDDYCPNGLQVEGRAPVSRLVSGVTASQALIDAAFARKADAILVHHGYFWRGEDPCISGMKRKRLHTLLNTDLSLLAYHLPLDAHPELGNNVQLARLLDITIKGGFPGQSPAIALQGELGESMTGEQLAELIQHKLGRAPLYIPAHIPGHISDRPTSIRTIGWCTGAAQQFIEQAAMLGLDAYLSGEISEQTVHVARELGIHYFAAGHHATERYGVQALGEHLASKFDIEHEFIDIDNPV